MRGYPSLLCDTSSVDPNNGLLIRGHDLPTLLKVLPTAPQGDQPLPEGLLWLLLTGSLPKREEAELVSNELKKRSHLPAHVYRVLDSLPTSTHPMTQFSAAICACQTESQFAQHRAAGGIARDLYWMSYLEDGLGVVAKAPLIAAHIYRRSFHHSIALPYRSDLDWTANLGHMMGFEDRDVHEMLRLYMTLHADHEGGNVSAHTGILVGSALSDAYLSYAAAMNGLAGPLHGLANQDCLNWLTWAHQQLNGAPPSEEAVRTLARRWLQKGRVIPGYGHAVLRVTDPRFTAQLAFAETRFKGVPLFELLKVASDVIPHVLLSTGKVSNPYPNVYAHSGYILTAYGIPESRFYTVLFGISRAMGVIAQLVWARALHLPIERPRSITIDQLAKLAEESNMPNAK
eukprot:GHVU01218845.1.p1 GENE.GHVU01218845.1~~GHVU01218845.1.p1  ORF type:complete len:401 (+),score=50.07 GHVU01218845.1:600-1802(+)